jgi:hypothetical protein
MASSTWSGTRHIGHLHAVPMEDGADGSSVDAEPTQVVAPVA